MEGLVDLDESVNRLGYLRLSTTARFARHIGNAISEEIKSDAESLGYQAAGEVPRIVEQKHWLLRIPGSGRILRMVYNWLFKVLNRVK